MDINSLTDKIIGAAIVPKKAVNRRYTPIDHRLEKIIALTGKASRLFKKVMVFSAFVGVFGGSTAVCRIAVHLL